MTEFSGNLTFDKQETVVLASRIPGGSASESDPLEHALRATSIELAVDARSSVGGTLVLTAEESEDGESWSDIEAVGTLTRTGSASLTVTPTLDWLRVAWEGGASWTIDITATGHATIEAGSIPSAGSSASNSIRLLGPYDIAFDTPDILTGVVLEAFADGDVITESWIQVFARFGSLNGNESYMVVDLVTDGPSPYQFSEFSLLGGEEATANDIEEAQITTFNSEYQTQTLSGYTGDQTRPMPVRLRAACNVTAVVLTDGTGGLTEGSARLWLHAATPLA